MSAHMQTTACSSHSVNPGGADQRFLGPWEEFYLTLLSKTCVTLLAVKAHWCDVNDNLQNGQQAADQSRTKCDFFAVCCPGKNYC